jgi:hypothetical protein
MIFRFGAMQSTQFEKSRLPRGLTGTRVFTKSMRCFPFMSSRGDRVFPQLSFCPEIAEGARHMS